MDHRVDVVLGENLGDLRAADVRPDEFGGAELVRRVDRVDRDHPFHLRVPLDPPHEAAPEMPGGTGDEHDLAQDQRLPSVFRWSPP